MSPADRSVHHATRRRLRLPPMALAVALATGLAPALQAASPELDVDAMTFVASKGQLNELVLNATHARFDTSAEIVFLEDVTAVVAPTSSAGHFEIECDEGELDLATNDFEARGNVKGRTDGNREFEAPWVKYRHEEGILFTDAPVLMSEDATTYRGSGGFKYFVRERRFKLLGGASVVQTPEDEE